jgi:hypothetical protein
MAIEAPYSKHNKTNLKIWIVVSVGLALAFAYDGYLSKYEWSHRRSFYEEHVKDGIPDSDMVLNQKLPFVLIPLAAIVTGWLLVSRNRKLIAGDNEFMISAKKKIPYDSIEKIDKTYFDKKGFFVITYKNRHGIEVRRKISGRKYDNLGPILDHLVAKIS